MATRLVHRESGGLLCRSLLPPQELARFWGGQTPVDQVVDQASSDKFRLLDVNQLLIGGNEGLYVSLSQDALVPVAARWSEDSKRRQFTRSRVIDMLWIFIPLLFLVGAVTFYFTRQAGGGTDGKDGDEVVTKKQIQEFLKQQQKQFVAELRTLDYPLFVGNLSLADQFLNAGNTTRLRQVLLNYTPNKDEPDLRSFEWFYLWGRGQQQRHDLFGHAGLVTSVAATADGKTIASGSLDGTVKLWDGASGQILATLLGHKGPVHGVAFSPDGKMLVSAGADKTVQLWNVAPGKEYEVMQKPAKTLEGHTEAVLAVAFSSDNRTIASGSADKTVILWNVTAGEKQELPKEHKGAVQAVAFSPDGKTLASAGSDRLVILWKVADASKQFVLDGHTGPVFAVAFSPSGTVLASGGEDKKDNVEIGLVRFWDPAKGKPVGEPVIQHSRGIFALSFMDDKALVTGGKDNLLRFWDPTSSKQLGALPGHLGWVRSLALSANGKTIVSGSFDRTVKIWEGGPKVDVLRGHKDWVCAVAFSPDDRLLASGSRDGSVRIWDSLSGQLLDTLENLGGSVLAVAFSPDKDNPKLAAGIWADKGAVKVWDLILDKNKNFQKAKEIHTLLGHKGGVACVAFDKTGKRLASGSGDKTIIVWDLEKGKPEQTLKGHQGGVRTLAFAASGKLASGSDDASIRVWDPATGKEIGAPLTGHSGAVNSVAFLSLGIAELPELLVSGSNDQTVRLWNEGKPAGIFRGHANAVSAVAVSPKWGFFASASWDSTIKFWASSSTDERFTLTGPTEPIRALAISRNGLTLAAASNDGTVRLWRAASEKSLPPD
jgi:WD40 repeat protein